MRSCHRHDCSGSGTGLDFLKKPFYYENFDFNLFTFDLLSNEILWLSLPPTFLTEEVRGYRLDMMTNIGRPAAWSERLTIPYRAPRGYGHTDIQPVRSTRKIMNEVLPFADGRYVLVLDVYDDHHHGKRTSGFTWAVSDISKQPKWDRSGSDHDIICAFDFLFPKGFDESRSPVYDERKMWFMPFHFEKQDRLIRTDVKAFKLRSEAVQSNEGTQLKTEVEMESAKVYMAVMLRPDRYRHEHKWSTWPLHNAEETNDSRSDTMGCDGPVVWSADMTLTTTRKVSPSGEVSIISTKFDVAPLAIERYPEFLLPSIDKKRSKLLKFVPRFFPRRRLLFLDCLVSRARIWEHEIQVCSQKTAIQFHTKEYLPAKEKVPREQIASTTASFINPETGIEHHNLREHLWREDYLVQGQTEHWCERESVLLPKPSDGTSSNPANELMNYNAANGQFAWSDEDGWVAFSDRIVFFDN
ncbi:hypothetical protein BJ508DRAFT_305830 [Ascobolus immersus RN42]|uniref:Uncharacterized protein n=1 Tax=Ascobolus immersus RN42 TaxID=1160509 RepID=A0A3N4IDF7_ASCIM|nr:hypothetical protein BJ508DRAFT_305830 [Ascobolus immersus RN42]